MPPKKPGGDKVSKKTDLKKKEKIIEDKTFGMKNKKGGKSQKMIAQIEKQVKSGGDPKNRRLEELKLLEKKAKEDAKKKEEEEKRLLYQPISAQKIEQGVDPKSVFCAFFKQGLCKKGDRCKFSHDPDVERKAAKRNIYSDMRDEDGGDGNMDDWDEEKLAEVVNKKHGQEKSNQTDIICKFFLDAVEGSKYGWFWTCPNGGDNCMYKHALPSGFMLKKDRKREDKKDEISIEELVENKRAELCARSDLTPVTLETFLKWKRKKLQEKAAALKLEDERKKDKARSGFIQGLSGREMFSFDPSIAKDEDDDEGGVAFDMTAREREEGDDDGNVKVHEIKFDEYGIMDDGLDDPTEVQLAKYLKATASAAAAAVPSATENGTAGEAAAEAIDEDLFNDEDLDELEENLENLEV